MQVTFDHGLCSLHHLTLKCTIRLLYLFNMLGMKTTLKVLCCAPVGSDLIKRRVRYAPGGGSSFIKRRVIAHAPILISYVF
jgi:hypothetical protein